MLAPNLLKAMSTEEEQPHNSFMLFWDCYGLEFCQDLTDKMSEAATIDKHNLFDRLKDPETEPPNSAVREMGRIIQMASLRARFNPDRNYELYWLNTEPTITKADIEEWFEETPQSAVDTVRKSGLKLFSGRVTENERVIT
jgi:hypothetical protein